MMLFLRLAKGHGQQFQALPSQATDNLSPGASIRQTLFLADQAGAIFLSTGTTLTVTQ